MCRMPYGDVAFDGNGPDGRPISIGIEYKTVSDVLACICDGRFAGHQLPGLVQHYEVPILLMEGGTRPDMTSGLLQIQHRKGFWFVPKAGVRQFMYRDLQHWLFTVVFKAGVRLLRTSTLDETAAQIVSLYTWWTAKEWEEHRSHLAMVDQMRDSALIFKPGLVRRMAKELPGVGWDRSAKVAAKFPTVIDMALADATDWASIPGIGPKTAAGVCAALRGEAVKNGRH